MYSKNLTFENLQAFLLGTDRLLQLHEKVLVCNAVLRLRNNPQLEIKYLDKESISTITTLIESIRHFYYNLETDYKDIFISTIMCLIEAEPIIHNIKLERNFDKFSYQSNIPEDKISKIIYELELKREQSPETFKYISREFLRLRYGLGKKSLTLVENKLAHIFVSNEELKKYDIPTAAISQLYRRGIFCMEQLKEHQGTIEEDFGKIRGIGKIAIQKMENGIIAYKLTCTNI